MISVETGDLDGKSDTFWIFQQAFLLLLQWQFVTILIDIILSHHFAVSTEFQPLWEACVVTWTQRFVTKRLEQMERVYDPGSDPGSDNILDVIFNKKAGEEYDIVPCTLKNTWMLENV